MSIAAPQSVDAEPNSDEFFGTHVIFDNGMHGAMANADMNMDFFLCDSLVFLDQIINLCNHIKHNGSMGLSQAKIVLQ